MPIVKPVEEELEKLYLPSTADLPNEEDRAWVVFDISPAMGRDLVTIQGRDSSGMTLLKSILRRLKEWNYFTEDGVAWPITLETVQSLLDTTDINFLSDKIKVSRTIEPLSNSEKKG